MLSDLDELAVKSAAAAIDALATFMYTNSGASWRLTERSCSSLETRGLLAAVALRT